MGTMYQDSGTNAIMRSSVKEAEDTETPECKGYLHVDVKISPKATTMIDLYTVLCRPHFAVPYSSVLSQWVEEQ